MQLLLVLLGIAGVYKLAKAADAASGKPVVRGGSGAVAEGIQWAEDEEREKKEARSLCVCLCVFCVCVLLIACV